MKLDQKLQAFNEKRNAFLDEMESLEPEKLVAKPLPGKWSILEIIEHLALAERSVLQGLPEPSLLERRETNPKHRIRYLTVLFVLRAGVPVQVGSPAMLPKGRDLAESRRLWDENQEWLRGYIDSLDAKGTGTAFLEHPQAGPISVRQAVVLCHAHLDSHRRQIRVLQRLLRG